MGPKSYQNKSIISSFCWKKHSLARIWGVCRSSIRYWRISWSKI